MNAKDKGKKRITLFIDPEIHKELAAECAGNHTSMSNTLKTAVWAIAKGKVSFYGSSIIIDNTAKWLPINWETL